MYGLHYLTDFDAIGRPELSKLMTGVTIDVSQSMCDRAGFGNRRRRKSFNNKRRRTGLDDEFEDEYADLPTQQLVMTSPTVETRSGRIATMSWKGLTSQLQIKKIAPTTYSNSFIDYSGHAMHDNDYDDDEENDEVEYEEDEEEAAIAIEALISFSQIKA